MFLRKSGGVKTHLKKAMGLGIASAFIVGGSIGAIGTVFRRKLRTNK